MRRLHVAVDARLRPGTAGGVENVIIGLAQGLSQVAATDVVVTFVALSGGAAWLAPHLGRSMRLATVDGSRLLPRVVQRLRDARARPLALTVDVAMERMRADVVHYPFQTAGLVSVPSIYHPHDLQHRHLPGFFTASQLADREARYPALCRAAAAVAVGSSWVKDDVVEQFSIPSEKVYVVPLAPVEAIRTATPEDIDDLGLPERYAVLPAGSWAHKNHARLFAALAELRRRGIEIPLVLTGPRPPEGVDLVRAARESGVKDLVRDLGYLPLGTARSVLAGATLMVMPTLFEAASFPIWEAFGLGVPVACSDVTSLPKQVGDAALVFDPHDSDGIAKSIGSLWESPELCSELAARGRARVAEFTWEGTARTFLALYRELGGRTLSEADEHLLRREPRL
jgi:glycosyltransferase involved in cell wall biosynthesis